MIAKDFFKVPLNLLKCLGFLPKYEDSIRGKFWHGYTMFTFLLIFVTQSLQIHSFIKSFEKLDKLIANIGTFTQSLFLSTKLLSFYLQRETFNDLMENLLEISNKSEIIYGLLKAL
jgi:hypothetical protein